MSMILAMDTATSGCSVALVRGETVLARVSLDMGRGQAEALLPMVQDVLAEAGIAPDQLDAVAVTRGPGAFTGLRIGLATARAYAMTIGKPCIGITTLEAVARAVHADERQGRDLIVCIESKRDDVFVQRFDGEGVALSEPQASDGPTLAALAGGPVLLVGDAAKRAQIMLKQQGVDAALSAASGLPDPVLIAHIAAKRLDQPNRAPEPLYLRPPDAKTLAEQGKL